MSSSGRNQVEKTSRFSTHWQPAAFIGGVRAVAVVVVVAFMWSALEHGRAVDDDRKTRGTTTDQDRAEPDLRQHPLRLCQHRGPSMDHTIVAHALLRRNGDPLAIVGSSLTKQLQRFHSILGSAAVQKVAAKSSPVRPSLLCNGSQRHSARGR